MTETDLCKSLVQQAFNHRAMVNVGLIDGFDRKELVIRTELWRAAGYTVEEVKHRYEVETVKSKKQALVMLYKAWSAFSKGLRHLFVAKQAAVFVPRIGTFFNTQRTNDDDETVVASVFVPAKELARTMNIEREENVTRLADVVRTSELNWTQIAAAADINSADIAELFVYQIFQQAVQATSKMSVSLDVKIGHILFEAGSVTF